MEVFCIEDTHHQHRTNDCALLYAKTELQKGDARRVPVGFCVEGRMRESNSIASFDFGCMVRSLYQTLLGVPD